MTFPANKDLKVGDTVMVWQWPHEHCSSKMPVGKPFVISRIDPDGSHCSLCNTQFPAPTVYGDGRCMPAAWTHRIFPLDDHTTVRSLMSE